MKRASIAVLGLALALGGCGDPVVVLGDAPGFMRVIAGIPDSIGSVVDSLALRTRLYEPSAAGFDRERGLVYIADRGAVRQQGGITQRVTRIMSVDSRSRLRLRIDAGNCTPGPCLHHAAQMVPAPDGTLLIADPVGHRVFRFDPATNALTAIAGTGVDEAAPDGAPAASSPLRSPHGVAVGDDGRIFISEYGAHRVRYIDATGALQTIAGVGTRGYAGDGGPAGQALLGQPNALAVGDDILYIAEAWNHTVRAVDLRDGSIVTVTGTGGPGSGGDGGPAVFAQLNVPSGLVLSVDGSTLFIADRENHRVRMVRLASGIIDTFAGSGSPLFVGPRGPAGEMSLRWPTGLAITDLGFLYIVDTGHYVVWRAALTL